MSKKKSANKMGSIRKRKDGRWECRITVGKDPGTGKQIRKSIYADTQADLVKEKKSIEADMASGKYIESSKLTVGAWMDEWIKTYVEDVKDGVKESTLASYKGHINNHIKPSLGAMEIQKLTSRDVQKFYNQLSKNGKSAKTVKNIHGVFHQALQRAVIEKIIKENPATERTLPKVIKPNITVMDDETVKHFLNAIEGHRFKAIYFVDLFTGMRQAEILGLTWDCVELEKGIITINKQLVKSKLDARYYLDIPKHDKLRKIKPAQDVIDMLRQRKVQQAADQLLAGSLWNNEWNLVFTNELGGHLVHHTVRKHFKRIVASIGEPDLTFHSLRHSYAVVSLGNGDDPVTVQTNLGHHTAAFTLEVYGHTTEDLQTQSANRMQGYIESIQNQSN